ncbi:TolC family outer membrane protein [Seleniivibrio woodruffii]|uniref:TolC family outer membrane protein n=1 Tax=Seleniivibrio woodruffii TaxID=1078050 RepID=UPI0026F336B8|nr:TolC family outer membrane protein [Seleniivibrio woodruffii]
MKRLIAGLVLLPALSAGFALADTGIREAYDRAIENDSILQSARHYQKSAEAVRKQTRAGLLPNVSGQYTALKYDTDRYGDYDTRELTVNLVQPVFDLNRYRQHEQSRYTLQSSDAKLKSAESNLIVRVVTAYMNVLYAKDNVELMKAKKQGAQEQLVQAEKMFRSGLVAVTNVHEAQANLDTAEYEIVNAQNAYLNNMVELESITGKIDGVRCLGSGFGYASHELGTLDHWIETAAQNSSEVKYYKAQSKYADENVKIAKTQYIPTLNLIAAYRKSDQVSNIKSTETVYKSLGAQVSVPIFSGGYTAAKVMESKERFYQSVSDMNTAVNEMKKNVSEKYTALLGSKAKITALERTSASNTLAYESNKKSMSAGVVTLVDVINAQNNMFDSLSRLLQAKYEYFTGYIDLKYYAGVLTAADVDFLETLVNSECKVN